MLTSRVGRSIVTVALVALSLAVGFLIGHVYGTGTFPLAQTQQIRMPDAASVTLHETQTVLEPLREQEYREGYTCLDFAWEAMRAMRWQGYETLIVVLELDPEPHHAVLLVPTTDEGWIFMDPQCGGCPLKPAVGGKYFNRTITGIYVLQMELVEIEEFFSGTYES